MVKRRNINKRNLYTISGGLLIALATVFGFYLYSVTQKTNKEGFTKTIHIAIENNSENNQKDLLSIKIDGRKLFSKIVTKKDSEEFHIKLPEGKTKLELFSNEKSILLDSISITSAGIYDLNISYWDSIGRKKFNYWIEEIWLD